MIRQLDERIWVCGQIAPEQVAALVGQGVTLLVNNRPDAEDSGQPAASAVEEAAASAGLAYRFIPISRGIGPAEIEAMQEAIREAGDGAMLAFCRSGMRSAMAASLAMREDGVPAEEVRRRLSEAGFDPGPIAHLL